MLGHAEGGLSSLGATATACVFGSRGSRGRVLNEDLRMVLVVVVVEGNGVEGRGIDALEPDTA